MIRHVVALQLNADEPLRRARDAEEVKRRLEELSDVNSGIISIDVYFDLGEISAHWPLLLVADYSSRESLEEYQRDPRHRDVVQWMNDGVVSDRVVIDFEIP